MKKRIIFYKSRNNYWKPFSKFLDDLRIDPIMIGEAFLAVESKGSYAEIYSPKDSKLIDILKKLDIKYFYSMGLYIGMMRPGKWFKPSLPLAHHLTPYCNKPVNCCIVSKKGERFFLYGKRVYQENILRWRPGLVLVVNNNGEAIGWGKGTIANIGGVRRRLLEPIWDLGWYLRRGG